MREEATPSLERIRELLEASQELGFQAANRKEVYGKGTSPFPGACGTVAAA